MKTKRITIPTTQRATMETGKNSKTYKVLYIKFLKLRESRQQHVHDLNSLQTEKSSLLLKIQDLKEKLLETQLQLERVTGEKHTHMLSIQKFPIDKPGLGYVASTSDIPSTSKIVFIKPTVPEPPPVYVDKGKAVIEREDPVGTKIIKKPSTKRSPPICHHCGVSGHIRPKRPHRQAQKKLSRHATLGTRPPARYQAPQHQRQQQRFVLANQSGKPEKNKSRHYKEKPQTPESNQIYEGLPLFSILMQNLLRWSESQLKACQQPP
jgi:hypothetical protein